MFAKRGGRDIVRIMSLVNMHLSICYRIVAVGGALLQIFCAANWTGPPLIAIEPITNEKWQQLCLEELSINGEVGWDELPW